MSNGAVLKIKIMREILTAALKKAVEEEGYIFYSGFEYRAGKIEGNFPAVWLAPPKLVNVTGEEDGEREYAVELVLMASGVGIKERGDVWSKLEQDAVEIYHRIGKECAVVRVEDLKCWPGEYALTGYGEVSMKMTCRVVLFWQNGWCEK